MEPIGKLGSIAWMPDRQAQMNEQIMRWLQWSPTRPWKPCMPKLTVV